jgi:hypothetical protein
MKWEEKSNRMPESARRNGAKNDVWNDMFAINPNSDIEYYWSKRNKTCEQFPVGRVAGIFDWSTADLSLGPRTLHIRVTITNPKNCDCEKAAVTVTARQVMDSAISPFPGTFITPDPDE